MTVVDLELEWCEVCFSQHGGLRPCPGNVDVDEPERRGRCFVARSEIGVEHYQTLVAPVGELWRARVFTHPGKLWGVPSGKGPARFYGDSDTEAERKAARKIFRRCRLLGLGVSEITPDALDSDDTSMENPVVGRRFERQLPAMFGIEGATHLAYVSNLSKSGVFLATGRPLQVGQRIKIVLNCGHYTIPLVGIVARNVTPNAEGALGGMGVELDDPSFVYLDFISKLEP